MGLLKDFIDKWKERKAKSNELEDNVRIQERVMAKRKSANERELDGYLEEQRQARIKAEVEKFREQKKHEHWNSPTALDTENMFKKKSNMILTGRSVFLR